MPTAILNEVLAMGQGLRAMQTLIQALDVKLACIARTLDAIHGPEIVRSHYARAFEELTGEPLDEPEVDETPDEGEILTPEPAQAAERGDGEG